MELNEAQRLILHNQYEILKFFDKDNKRKCNEYDECQSILEKGCEYDYDSLIGSFEFTPRYVSKEVHDILSMFRNMYASYRQLVDKSEISKEDCIFSGFDDENEKEYYYYTKWLIETRKLYSEFSNVELESFYSKLGIYRGMLSRYQEIQKKRKLSEKTTVDNLLSANELKDIISK